MPVLRESKAFAATYSWCTPTRAACTCNDLSVGEAYIMSTKLTDILLTLASLLTAAALPYGL